MIIRASLSISSKAVMTTNWPPSPGLLRSSRWLPCVLPGKRNFYARWKSSPAVTQKQRSRRGLRPSRCAGAGRAIPRARPCLRRSPQLRPRSSRLPRSTARKFVTGSVRQRTLRGQSVEAAHRRVRPILPAGTLLFLPRSTVWPSMPVRFPTPCAPTLPAGGDNAGRAGMIGAWLGAHLGLSAIPVAWRQRLTAHAQVEASIEKLLTASIAC